MPTFLKRILGPLSSLKITVTLLLMAILLVFAGTLAQRDMSVLAVQHRYFHSLFFWLPLREIVFYNVSVAGKPLVMPMLGGYALGALLLINLLSAHLLRFKARLRDLFLLPALGAIFIVGHLAQNLTVYWLALAMLGAAIPFFVLLAIWHGKRTGVILIHLGIVLLLVGEGITSVLAVESQMRISEGENKNWSQDIRFAELAVTDTSPKDHDQVTVVSTDRLREALKDHQPITNARLPFDVAVDAYYANATRLGPFQLTSHPDALRADVGELKDLGAIAIPEVSGADVTDGRVDVPAAYVTLSSKGKRLGRYVLFVETETPQTVTVDGKTYQIELRFRRLYKPYTINLIKFSFDRFAGTNHAQNYSSLVKLHDPTRNESREVRIWMNHPMRYHGESFYQSGFDPEREDTTILQIVTNPGWQMPYVACTIGAIGLITHFLMTLLNFMGKQSRGRGKVEYIGEVSRVPSKNKGNGKRKATELSAELADGNGGRRHIAALLPIALVALCALSVVMHLIPPRRAATDMDLAAFGAIPISQDGRTQPYDSIARNALKVICEAQSYTEPEDRNHPDKKLQKMSAVQWLLEVQARPLEAAKLKVFRIDHKDIAGLLSTNLLDKMFSLDDLLNHWPELGEQFAALGDKMPKSPTLLETKLNDLRSQLRMYFLISGQESVRKLIEGRRMFPVSEPALRKLLHMPDDETNATFEEIVKQGDLLFPIATQAKKLIQSGREADVPPRERLVYDLVEEAQTFYTLAGSTEPLQAIPPAPGDKPDAWSTLAAADARERQSGEANADAHATQAILDAYAAQDAPAFNAAVAAYQARLSTRLGGVSNRAEFEAGFNRVDPFMLCLVFYVLVFVLVAIGWLGFSEEWSISLRRAAFGVAVLALLVHTSGLIAHIYISQRPPVTNLATSAIFIAWGIVVLATGFEMYFRNGIGLAAAAAAGFLSLLIARGLSAEGDTFEALQPVLDTNWWLATHVVCVTLGYASTFLAGVLGVVYVVWSRFCNMDKEDSRTPSRMIYGVVCFAILFSFVGTVLGGIWADQSWGRFWGWDPKENGAVLIVLMNAVTLHARWGGMVKARGIATLVILGNIVTAWSWFGTNMLGIGLHAYGFMQSHFVYLMIFVISQVIIAGFSFLTREKIAS